METKIADLTAANQGLTNQVEQLSSQVINQTASQDDLRKQLEEAQKEKSTLRQKIAALQASHETEVNQNKETQTSLEKNIAELQVPTCALCFSIFVTNCAV